MFFASASRAMNAEVKGCSMPMTSHMAARGNQKKKISRCVTGPWPFARLFFFMV